MLIVYANIWRERKREREIECVICVRSNGQIRIGVPFLHVLRIIIVVSMHYRRLCAVGGEEMYTTVSDKNSQHAIM